MIKWNLAIPYWRISMISIFSGIGNFSSWAVSTIQIPSGESHFFSIMDDNPFEIEEKIYKKIGMKPEIILSGES